MKTEKSPFCYLCGAPLEEMAHSDDHVLPKTLLAHKQPKVKGFDYAGTLPTHPKCNNEFGPETYVSKALDLIAGLHNPECCFEYRHPADESIRMMALNSAYLPNFTKQELRFFKFIDARPLSSQDILRLSLLDGQIATNPKRDALFAALAVLTKSAAALLVSRKLKAVPAHWEVMAVPFVGETDTVDFDDLFGQTKPFGATLKVWVGHLDTGDFLAIYRTKQVIVFFLFQFAPTRAAWDKMTTRFSDATRLRFSGDRLTELINYAWEKLA